MNTNAVSESVYSVTGYLKENYDLLIMLFGVFVVYSGSKRINLPRAERILPIAAQGVFICSILDYFDQYFSTFDTYTIGRSICRALESEIYPILLFIVLCTLSPKRYMKLLGIPLVINTVYCILLLFNTKLGAYYTEDNQFHRGVLGYIPYIVNMIYLLLLYYFTQQPFRENKILRNRLFLFITLTLALTSTLVLLGVIPNMNTICVFSILLYMLYFTITQQANIRRELMIADMQLYQRQIRPHFIYNGLGLIRSLLPREESEAKDVLDHFTRYLRGNAEILTIRDLIPLSKELEIIDNYLYMAEKRFEDSIIVERDLRDMDFMVPALSVQILVENAIRHGIRKREDGSGTLWLSSYTKNKYHTIEVRDNGVGFDTKELIDRWEEESRTGGADWLELQQKNPDQSHLGLINLRKRLEIQCDGGLSISSTIGEGTLARITIPVKNDKDMQQGSAEEDENTDR